MEHFPFYVRELVACLSVWYVGGNRKWMGWIRFGQQQSHKVEQIVFTLKLPINFDMIKLVSGNPPNITPKNSKMFNLLSYFLLFFLKNVIKITYDFFIPKN